MEKKKSQAMIQKTIRRMKRCIKEGNPSAGELGKAGMAWAMWIDCLHDNGLIDAVDQLRMKIDMKEFLEIFRKEKRRRPA